MRSRIVQILCGGGIALMVMYLVPDYLAWQNRYKSDAVLGGEQRIRQFERDRAHLRSTATTDDEKTLVSYWFDRDFEKERARFRASDGVDRYEAWMLATTYYGVVFGSCGGVGLPQRSGAHWSVPIGIGSTARPGLISVDVSTGRITSEGRPVITDPIAFLRHPEVPNQAPEPTTTSVMPAAEQPSRRP